MIFKGSGKLRFVIFPGRMAHPDAYCPVITAVGKVADHLVVGNELGQLFAYRIGDQELLGLGPEKCLGYHISSQSPILGIRPLDHNPSALRRRLVGRSVEAKQAAFFYFWTKNHLGLFSLNDLQLVNIVAPFGLGIYATQANQPSLEISEVHPVLSSPCCVLVYSKSPRLSRDVNRIHKL